MIGCFDILICLLIYIDYIYILSLFVVTFIIFYPFYYWYLFIYCVFWTSRMVFKQRGMPVLACDTNKTIKKNGRSVPFFCRCRSARLGTSRLDYSCLHVEIWRNTNVWQKLVTTYRRSWNSWENFLTCRELFLTICAREKLVRRVSYEIYKVELFVKQVMV